MRSCKEVRNRIDHGVALKLGDKLNRMKTSWQFSCNDCIGRQRWENTVSVSAFGACVRGNGLGEDKGFGTTWPISQDGEFVTIDSWCCFS